MPPDKDQINTPLNQTEPQTVDEAADESIETLDLEERVRISNLPNSDVKILQTVLGRYTEKQLERYYIDETYQDLDGPYGRIVGFVFVGDKNLNKELLSAGLAWHYKQYSRDPELAKLEFEARSAKRGLWAESDPMPPWEWRRMKRQ